MSDETKKPRTYAEINQEYNQVAFQAGQAQYQAFIHKDNLRAFNERLRELALEGHEVKMAEAAAATTPAVATETAAEDLPSAEGAKS